MFTRVWLSEWPENAKPSQTFSTVIHSAPPTVNVDMNVDMNVYRPVLSFVPVPPIYQVL